MSAVGGEPAPAFDLFLCHAPEDRAALVEPLIAALQGRGLTVWYHPTEVHLGDSVRERVNAGLRAARFGLVVVSPHSSSYWPRAELDALFTQEALDPSGPPRVLPIRFGLTEAELAASDPLLAPRVSVSAELGIAEIARRVDEIVRAEATSPVKRSPAYGVPGRRALELIGRDEDLLRLDAALIAGSRVRVAASVEGLAGVGKTELALHLVDRLERTDRFPGGIYWLTAEHPDLRPIWGTDVADALAVSPGTVDDRATSVLRMISGGGPALVVLDNVERWAGTDVPHPLPTGSHVALLVTTRHRNLGGAAFTHVACECLAAHAARALLLAVAARDLASPLGVDDLLTYLDGHALAIELAGAYLCEFPDVSPHAYLALLRGGAPVEERVRDLTRYERTLTQAFDTTWMQLDESARRALLVAGNFADTEAPLGALAAAGVDDDARRTLRRFHLLAETGNRWTMHRLVRSYARGAGSSDERALAGAGFVAGCVGIAAQVDDRSGYQIYRDERLHLERAIGVVPTDSPAFLTAIFLRDRLGTAAQAAGDFALAATLLGTAFEMASAIDADSELTNTVRNNLASVYRDLGDLRGARSLHEVALEWALGRLGENARTVAIYRSNLGLVLQRLGEVTRACELLEQAHLWADANLPADDRFLAAVRMNLAEALKELGDLPRARVLLAQVVETAERTPADHDLILATSRKDLAAVLHLLGDLEQARDLLEQSLVSQVTSLEVDHPNVAATRAALGQVLEDLGDLPRARELEEQALTRLSGVLPPDHPDLVVLKSNLASVYIHLGEYPRARELLETALPVATRQFGPLHTTTASIQFNLGCLLEATGDDAGARDLLGESLTVLEHIENQPRAAVAAARLARCLARLDDRDAATAMMHRARGLISAQPLGSQYRSEVDRIARELGLE